MNTNVTGEEDVERTAASFGTIEVSVASVRVHVVVSVEEDDGDDEIFRCEGSTEARGEAGETLTKLNFTMPARPGTSGMLMSWSRPVAV